LRPRSPRGLRGVVVDGGLLRGENVAVQPVAVFAGLGVEHRRTRDAKAFDYGTAADGLRTTRIT
jgi:hypothetical protein